MLSCSGHLKTPLKKDRDTYFRYFLSFLLTVKKLYAIILIYNNKTQKTWGKHSMKAFENWDGTISINGKEINAAGLDKLNGKVTIRLIPKTTFIERFHKEETKPTLLSTDFSNNKGLYKITAKKYMTKKATPEFDFMAKFNNDIPMPLLTMVGTVEKETRGMVYMNLHGDITQTITDTCLCCGKPITNPISKYFGMGPICGNHNYVNPFGSQEELQAAIGEYRKRLQNITWSGWIIRSAIVEETIL